MKTSLDNSIEHWQRLAACKTLDEVLEEGYDSEDCALCSEYQYSSEEYCAGCPVFILTMLSMCIGTPYGKAANYIQSCCDDEREFDAEHWQELSQAQVYFLKSLEAPK